MPAIQQVTILGAGTMGLGLAGICANAGCQVLVLDVTPPTAERLATLTAGKSPVITDATRLASITVGAFATDLAKISNSDWICEAVVEDVQIKRQLFEQIEPHRRAGSMITTNTSGIPLHTLYAQMPPRFQHDIAVTHFFNPVHVMPLVELVAGEHTRPEVLPQLAAFFSAMGKGVVYAKDTVNFIGNRIGCLWLNVGLHLAESAMVEHGLSVEEVDALLGAPLGLPPTGLLGLVDLIGMDVLYKVNRNLQAHLPPRDLGRAYLDFPPRVQAMYARGQFGRKSGGGFYRRQREPDGSAAMAVFDWANDEWRPQRLSAMTEAPTEFTDLFAHASPGGRLVRALMTTTLGYAADLVPQIAADIVNVDRALCWGFAWQRGPFALIDQLGARAFIAQCQAESQPLPKMLQVLDDAGVDSFYREGEYLGVNGEWQPIAAPP